MRDTATQRNASALPNWEATSFGAVADFINGYAFKPSDWSKFGLPIIRIAQMLNADTATDHYEGELPNAYRIDDGDLLFSWSATLATVMWTRGPAWLNQHLFKVVPKAGNSVRFLHHLIDFHIESLAAQSHGTTMRHIKRGDLLSYPVLRPNPTEQSRIAAVLDTVDEAIAKTEAVIAKLKKVRAGLLHDLLTRGLDEHGQLRDSIAHPDQFQDSPLGRIPREWQCRTLEEAMEWFSGGTPNRSQVTWWHGNVPILTPKDMKAFELSDTIEHVTNEAARVGSRFMPSETVFIVVRGMILAHTFPVCLCTRPFAFNQDIKAVRGKQGLDNRFLAHWFVGNSALFLRKATEATHGTKKLDLDELHRVHIGVPSPEEQRAIVEHIEALDSIASVETAELAKLGALKSGLMTDLLTGRVRVPEHFGMRRHDAALSSQAHEPASGPFRPESAHESGDTSPALQRGGAMTDWPHAPVHRLSEVGAYMVTAGTYRKEHFLSGPERLTLVRDALFACANEFGWHLQAWAVMSNHYHFVAVSPTDAGSLRRLVGKLHMTTAKALNEMDGTPGRKIWHQYWDSRITYQPSYLARLQYVHHNPVHHGVALNADNYEWCSAAWFARTAEPAFVRTVASFKTDRLNVRDDFMPCLRGAADESGDTSPHSKGEEP